MLYKKLILAFGGFLLAHCMMAAVITQEDLREIARAANKASAGQCECRVEGRQLVYEFYLLDNSYLKDFDKDKLAGKIEDIISTLCATNFVTIRYDIHYTDDSGYERLKSVTLNTSDFLNYNSETREIISLKDHPKAFGVNLTMKKPKGWIEKDGDSPHIVKKFEVMEYENYTSYMIQMNDMPTFISRREAKEIFEGKNDLKIDFKEWRKNLFVAYDDVTILSEDMDAVGLYPAKRLEYLACVERQGVKISFYGVIWMIFYEDTFITLWGGTSCTEPETREQFKALFSIITNSVHFYDQYNDLNYGH